MKRKFYILGNNCDLERVTQERYHEWVKGHGFTNIQTYGEEKREYVYNSHGALVAEAIF